MGECLIVRLFSFLLRVLESRSAVALLFVLCALCAPSSYFLFVVSFEFGAENYFGIFGVGPR